MGSAGPARAVRRPTAAGPVPPMPEHRAELQPELWVNDGPAAVAFYQTAFGALVEHRVSGPADTDIVAQLSIAGAHFWVSSASEELRRLSPDAIGGATGRVLLVVSDPESALARALAAGATQRSPVGDEHGWRVGRIVDPFGHEWEVGRPLGLLATAGGCLIRPSWERAAARAPTTAAGVAGASADGPVGRRNDGRLLAAR